MSGREQRPPPLLLSRRVMPGVCVHAAAVTRRARPCRACTDAREGAGRAARRQ
jgi:hypothetical protein